MFFFTFFFLIIKTNDLQCHNQSKFCPKVQFSSFSSENWQFGFFVHAFQPKLWSIKHEECKTLKNGCEPPKVLETVSQRAIDNFQSPFKAIYLWSPQNFHNWLTLDWNFSECSLSKIGLKMTTINKKIWNQLKTNFARSNPAIENQTPQTYIWSVVFDE